MESDQTVSELSKLNTLIFRHTRAIVFRITASAVILIFIMTCVFSVSVTESNDMYPAIRGGDLIFCFRLGRVKRQSAVLYRTPVGVNVGRVQAVENDAIGMTEERELTVNGVIQPVQERMGIFSRTFFGKYDRLPPYTVKKNEYFILGDARSSARDSREFGPAARRQIVGTVFMTIRRRTI